MIMGTGLRWDGTAAAGIMPEMERMKMRTNNGSCVFLKTATDVA
jgi:hypothetical protein